MFRVADSGTATSRLVTEGEVAPGGDGVLGELGELRINGAGDVAFSARLRNTDGLPDTPFAGSTALDDSALYLARANGTLLQLAREGDEVSPGGARLGALADAFSGDVPRPSLNDDGAVAFRAGLFDVVPEAGTGIFIAAADGLTKSRAAVPLMTTACSAASNTRSSTGAAWWRSRPRSPSAKSTAKKARSRSMKPCWWCPMASISPPWRAKAMCSMATSCSTSTSTPIPTGPANGFDDVGRVAYQVIYASGARAINVWTPRALWRGSFDPPEQEAQWDSTRATGASACCRARRTTPFLSLTAADLRPRHGHHAGLAERRRHHAIGARCRWPWHPRRPQHRRRRERRGRRHAARRRRQPGLAARLTGTGTERGRRPLERWRDRVDADASVRYAGTYSGSGLISGAGTSLFDGGLDPGDSPTLMQVAGDVVLGAGNETGA